MVFDNDGNPFQPCGIDRRWFSPFESVPGPRTLAGPGFRDLAELE